MPIQQYSPTSRTAQARPEAAKATVDYVLAAVAVVILSPLYAILGLLVRLDSPGPVLHRRRVVGRGGRQFDAFKFRTMYVNGDAILAQRPDLAAIWAKEQKLKDDPRVTPTGRWLRKFSLDELPQLFNVLRGEMSLVGPRMMAPVELSRYEEHAEQILTIKPGITGLWQVSGRSDLDREDRVRLDLHYVRERGFWLDIKLILLTIPTVVRGRGAY